VIIKDDLNEACRTASDVAVDRSLAVAVRSNGRLLVAVIPDVLLAELHANNVVIPGGKPWRRADGREVRFFTEFNDS
jgi:hypothetical protein